MAIGGAANNTIQNRLQEICNKYCFEIYEHSKTRKDKYLNIPGFWFEVYEVLSPYHINNITVRTAFNEIRFIYDREKWNLDSNIIVHIKDIIK